MNRPFAISTSTDQIALRRVLFAIELIDAVTLERVSQGIDVRAYGLQGKPIVNTSDMFVWLDEDMGKLERISIDPRALPYEQVTLQAADLKLPLTSIELPPRVDYPFSVGISGLRGMLVEDRYRSEPVYDAEIQLSWLDQDGDWHHAPTRSHTTAKGGAFVAILRFTPADEPQLDAAGKLTVRLRVMRGDDERSSGDLHIVQGRVASALVLNECVFAWDELERSFS